MNLGIEGFEVGTAADGKVGLERALGEHWDLVILDIMLPGPDGLEILRRIRARDRDTAVILLSARGQEFDKVIGLDLGADDYLTKPFGLAELLARIKAVLRRHQKNNDVPPPPIEDISFGSVVVDMERRRVTRNGEEVVLTPKEFEVLGHFLSREDRVVTREDIFQNVWGPTHHGSIRTVDNFVSQLRAKLEDDPDQPVHLLTVRGVGYRFVAETDTR